MDWFVGHVRWIGLLVMGGGLVCWPREVDMFVGHVRWIGLLVM